MRQVPCKDFLSLSRIWYSSLNLNINLNSDLNNPENVLQDTIGSCQ